MRLRASTKARILQRARSWQCQWKAATTNSIRQSLNTFERPTSTRYMSSYLVDETRSFVRREPFHPILGREPDVCSTPQEAIDSLLESNDTVFVQSAAGTPIALTNALADVAKEVSDR